MLRREDHSGEEQMMLYERKRLLISTEERSDLKDQMEISSKILSMLSIQQLRKAARTSSHQAISVIE